MAALNFSKWVTPGAEKKTFGRKFGTAIKCPEITEEV